MDYLGKKLYCMDAKEVSKQLFVLSGDHFIIICSINHRINSILMTDILLALSMGQSILGYHKNLLSWSGIQGFLLCSSFVLLLPMVKMSLNSGLPCMKILWWSHAFQLTSHTYLFLIQIEQAKKHGKSRVSLLLRLREEI